MTGQDTKMVSDMGNPILLKFCRADAVVPVQFMLYHTGEFCSLEVSLRKGDICPLPQEKPLQSTWTYAWSSLAQVQVDPCQESESEIKKSYLQS